MASKWLLGQPVIENLLQGIVTDSIKENAEFQYKSGMQPKIVRRTDGNCCEWCSKMAGEYTYPDCPPDVYRRHNNCNCTVEYYPGDGMKQDVWSRKWSEDKEVLERRKSIGLKAVTSTELKRRRNIGIEKEEMTRRKISAEGHEIIDKPTYNKLTREFIQKGGIIIRGEMAERHLKAAKATASYIAGMDTAFIRDDATVSDVLEEMYHASQERGHMFGTSLNQKTVLLREIDAQKYLISVAKKYKIPIEEQEATIKMLAYYEKALKDLEGK